MQTHNVLLKQTQAIAIISANLDGEITVFNQNAEQLLGYKANEVIGEHTPLLFHEKEDLQHLQAQLSAELDNPISGFDVYKTLVDTSNFDHSWTYVSKDGRNIPVQTQVSAINNEQQQMIGLLFLVTQKNPVTVTPLAELPKQDVFDKVLKREFRRMQREQLPISILKIDMDHFKNYLHLEGEDATQLCLEQIAVILQQRIQRAGDLLSYYNHDEFAVLLPNTEQPGAVKVAEILRLLVASQQIPHPQTTTGLIVTISIGVATMQPGKDDSVEQLLQTVDRGLQQAKLDSRNCTRIGK